MTNVDAYKCDHCGKLNQNTCGWYGIESIGTLTEDCGFENEISYLHFCCKKCLREWINSEYKGD